MVRLILLIAILLLGMRLLFPSKWRALPKAIDRVVNATLAAFIIMYVTAVIWRMWKG